MEKRKNNDNMSENIKNIDTDDFNLSDVFLKENNIQYVKKVENHFRPYTPYMIKFSNNERKWFDKESLIIFLNNLSNEG